VLYDHAEQYTYMYVYMCEASCVAACRQPFRALSESTQEAVRDRGDSTVVIW
jgi:hypothetical protein